MKIRNRRVWELLIAIGAGGAIAEVGCPPFARIALEVSPQLLATRGADCMFVKSGTLAETFREAKVGEHRELHMSRDRSCIYKSLRVIHPKLYSQFLPLYPVHGRYRDPTSLYQN